MNVQGFFRERGMALWRMLQPRRQEAPASDLVGTPVVGDALRRGLTGRSIEMSEVEEEVAAQGRGQVAIVGRNADANRLLLARLREQPPVPAAASSPVDREGVFTLVDLPELGQAAASAGLPADLWAVGDIEGLLQGMDLLLYVFSAEGGWQPADAHWYARLRAAGEPQLPVAVAANRRSPEDSNGPNGIKSVAVRVDADGDDPELPDDDVLALVDAMLGLRPRLAVTLAQEIPCCRPQIAQRIIRQGALMTALVGAEPIPLLDLPLQVALNWKVALQLAAIYGQRSLDYASKEMAGTVAMNVGLRYTAQQVAKLVPVVGWLISAALSGSGTLILGNALLRRFQGDGFMPAAVHEQANLWRGRAATGTTWLRDRLPERPRWLHWRRAGEASAKLKPVTVPLTFRWWHRNGQGGHDD
jgi:uncharacterized protein (DUF697 family)